MLTGIMKLSLLVLLVGFAALVHSQDAETEDTEPPRLTLKGRVICVAAVKGRIAIAPGDELSDVCGSALALSIHNFGEDQAEFQVKFGLSDKCVVDADIIELTDAIDISSIDAEGNTTVDVAGAMAVPDTYNRCGTGCLMAYKLVADGDGELIASLGTMRECEEEGPTDITLEWKGSVDTTLLSGQEIDYGSTLGDIIPDLAVTVANSGRNVHRVTRDLQDSIVVAFRTNPYTQKEGEEYASFDKCKGRYELPDELKDNWEEGDDEEKDEDKEGKDDDKEEKDDADKRDRRSARQQLLKRRKRSPFSSQMKRVKRDEHEADNEDELEDEGEDSADGIFEMFKRWQSKLNTRTDEDISPCLDNLFHFYDVTLENGDITIDEAIRDDGTELEISLADIPIRGEGICGPYNPGVVHGELVIIADPLKLIPDSNNCNNAIRIKMNITCPEEVTEFPDCQLLPDPLSQGHKAEIRMPAWSSRLEYDGGLKQPDWYLEQSCDRFDYGLERVETHRWKFLADRYQRQAENDPRVCLEVELAEEEQDQLLVDKLDELVAEFESEQETDRKKRNVDEDDEEEEDEPREGGYEGGRADDRGMPDDEVIEALDMLRDEMGGHDEQLGKRIELLLGFLSEKREEKENATYGDVSEKMSFLEGEDGDAALCPENRTKSAAGRKGSESQMIDIIRNIVETGKSSASKEDEIPRSKCGWRKLQNVLSRGAGNQMNRDIKPMRHIGSVDFNSNKPLMIKYLRVLREKIDEGIDDVDELVLAVEGEMNRTIEDADCQSRDDALKNIYKPDDTYRVYWQMDRGVIYRGIKNPLLPRGASISWKPIMTCFCKDCEGVYSWGNNDQSYSEDREQGGFGGNGRSDFGESGSMPNFGGSESQTGMGQSGVGQSGVGQSGVGQSGVGQSGVGQSGVGQSGVGQSGNKPSRK